MESAEPTRFADIAQDLHRLKQSLIDMDSANIGVSDVDALATVAIEISAIRLQLKRLRAEQRLLGEEIERRALGR